MKTRKKLNRQKEGVSEKLIFIHFIAESSTDRDSLKFQHFKMKIELKPYGYSSSLMY